MLRDMDGDIVQTDNNEEFRHLVLLNVLRGERDYSILYGYLVEFKCKGMNKQEMYDNLEEMRKNVQTEEQEDLIRDLMDFVVGYCHPKWHVFD